MTTVEENPNKLDWMNDRKPVHPLRHPFLCDDIVMVCIRSAIKAGWYTDHETGKPITYSPEFLMSLVRREHVEAIKALRDGNMDKHLPHRLAFEVEIADMLILIFSMCGALGLDIGNAVAEKLAFNLEREDHRPENRPAWYGANAK